LRVSALSGADITAVQATINKDSRSGIKSGMDVLD